ncbi:MAG: exonuclease subunit SbcD [Clostridia bacterium]|nr:exonuclease subunit SbcD [Clostridia bacterium]
MKILHTSDWHIGKRLGVLPNRLDEQAQVLDEITQICDSENVELVIVAGDVFDTYTPSAEAEELFYHKIKQIAGDNRAVLIISGNHDDGVRLTATAPLAEEQGVYIVGNSRRAVSLKQTGRKVCPTRSGKGYVVFENERGERAFIGTLPYPNEARFKETKSSLSYVEQMRFWMDEGMNENTDGLPSVLVAHIFVAGGKVSEGEREIDLGGARAVPVESLPTASYVALGHLHKKQHMGKGHCYYSGSPLQYSFDEAPDKAVKVFDLTANGVENLKDVPLTAGKKLVHIETVGVENAMELIEKYADCWVDLLIHLDAPLITEDNERLHALGNLLSVNPDIKAEGEEWEVQSRKSMTSEQLFDAFYETQYGSAPKAELKELFLSIMQEIEER